jgi:hypothetical protein
MALWQHVILDLYLLFKTLVKTYLFSRFGVKS